MKEKIIKNPEAPGGRKDWEGRSPRVRLSLTHAQLAILAEWAKDYFNRNPDKMMDPEYANLNERIAGAILDIQKPLLTEVETTPLWDD